MMRLPVRLAALGAAVCFTASCSALLDTDSLNTSEPDAGALPDTGVQPDTGPDPDTGVTPTPTLELSTAGDITAMNITGGSSPGAAVSFTVRNTGTGASAALQQPLLSDETNFRIITATDGCTDTTLQPSATCTFEVQPKAVTNIAQYSATLLVNDTNVVATNPLTLTGSASGFVASLEASPEADTQPDTPAAAASFSFTFTNVGDERTGALTVSPLGGANSGKFTVTGGDCASAELVATASCTVTVESQNIVADGSYTSTLTVTDSTDPGVTAVASLTATATGYTPDIGITPNPDPFVFTVAAGDPVTVTPTEQVFTVANGGPGQTGTLEAAQLGGDDPGAFTVTTPDGCEDAVLQPAGDCSITVTVNTASTTENRLYNATLSVGDGTANASITLQANASGFTPTITLSSLDPGAALDEMDVVAPATEGTAVTFEVENTGFAATAAVPAPALTPDDGPLGIVNSTCTAILAPGGTCRFDVLPSATSNIPSYTADLSVGAGGGASAGPITLSGSASGFPEALDITPASASGMDITDGVSPGPAVTFTVTNTTGAESAILQAPNVTGDFGFAANTCTGTLAASASCTFDVHPVATADGPLSGTVTITDGTLTSNEVALAGTASGF